MRDASRKNASGSGIVAYACRPASVGEPARLPLHHPLGLHRADRRVPHDLVEPRRDLFATLTPGERRVGLTVGQGLSNRESAEHLYVPVKTIDYHLQTIYRRLDVRSRGQLAALVHGRSNV